MRILQITLGVIMAMLCSISILLAQPDGDPEASSTISFKIKNAGVTVDGKFERFSTDIQYDTNKPEQSIFQGTILVESINTGISLRDGHLRKSDYFDAKKFPEIRFLSQTVKSLSSEKLSISGLLTIRDITKPVAFEVNIEENDGMQIFTTSLRINRRDYDVGGKSWMMSDEVLIYIHIID
jgi:polyisoprenoid-binding protein YceI